MRPAEPNFGGPLVIQRLADLTVPSGVNTKVVFDTVINNFEGMFNLSRNTITISEIGWYRIMFTFNVALTVATNGMNIQLYKNVTGAYELFANNYVQPTTETNPAVVGQCIGIVHCVPGDDITAYVAQASGANATLYGKVNAGGDSSFLYIERISYTG